MNTRKISPPLKHLSVWIHLLSAWDTRKTYFLSQKTSIATPNRNHVKSFGSGESGAAAYVRFLECDSGGKNAANVAIHHDDAHQKNGKFLFKVPTVLICQQLVQGWMLQEWLIHTCNHKRWILWNKMVIESIWWIQLQLHTKRLLNRIPQFKYIVNKF